MLKRRQLTSCSLRFRNETQMGGVTSKSKTLTTQFRETREHVPVYVLDPQFLAPLHDTGDGRHRPYYVLSQGPFHQYATSAAHECSASLPDTHQNGLHVEAASKIQTRDTSGQDITSRTGLKQKLTNGDHYDRIGNYSRENVIEEPKKNIDADSKKHTSHNSNEETVVDSTEPQGTSENDKRCMTYEYLVTVFQKLIVKNVMVHDILPHLTFIEDEGKLLAVEQQRSPQEAVLMLLEEVVKSKEVRKWKMFMTALEKSKYDYIVQNIRGTQKIDSSCQVYYFRTLRVKLSEMIKMPRELLPRLCAESIITDNTRQEIEQVETNRGRISATELLLDIIPRKGTFWYRKFVQVLRDENMNEVADMLDIPEVMDCTSQSFSHAPKLTSLDRPKSCSEQETIHISDASDDHKVTGTVTHQPDNIDRNTDDRITSSAATLSMASETNDTMRNMHVEEDIYEIPDSILEKTELPLLPSSCRNDVNPPAVTEHTYKNTLSGAPEATHMMTHQEDSILQFKNNQSKDPIRIGSCTDSNLPDGEVTIDADGKSVTHPNNTKEQIDKNVQQVLQGDPVEPATIKPILCSVGVQVDRAELSPEQCEKEGDYLEPSAVANCGSNNQFVQSKGSVQTNASNVKHTESSTVTAEYEETLEDNLDEEHGDIEETIKTDIEKLRKETDLLRRTYLISKERTELLRSKCELQKALESTESEYQTLLQSQTVHDEAVSPEADDTLNQLYSEKTNQPISYDYGPLLRSSRRVRRQQSINEWRRTSSGFTDRLSQYQFDGLDVPMLPNDTVILYDYSTSKISETRAACFSDIDSAVFSDLSAC